MEVLAVNQMSIFFDVCVCVCVYALYKSSVFFNFYHK